MSLMYLVSGLDQAFVVADEFAVSFDGHLLELPASCDLVLAAQVPGDTFAITLKSSSPKQRSLVVQLENTTVAIHPNDQVQNEATYLLINLIINGSNY